MLRDMEDLLNKVYDEEVKGYLKEALKCYLGGSYRACVIMSVIAGIYDLHKKVKALAGSNPDFKSLDDEVERKKRVLEVYEKYLIEQCATEGIDMLNNNELKELQRCLDTRNDCAHPSNFICSPEKARDIYSSIIDILASKPVLFGCKHMKNVINEMEEKTFFPVIDTSKMKVIVSEKLMRFQKKAIAPFLKLIGTAIKNPNSAIQKNNAIRFLALSAEFVSEKYEGFMIEFIEKDQYESELLALLEINTDILKLLSDINIEKIICKLETNLMTKEITNLDTWIKIILSDKLQEDKYLETLTKKITSFKAPTFFTDYTTNRDVRYQVVIRILENANCSEKFREMLRNGCYKDFTLGHYQEPYLQKILVLLNDNTLYEFWLRKIKDNINRYDFNIGNTATAIFKSINKEYWIDSVTAELKVSLVKKILLEGTKDGYYSHNCEELMNCLHNQYPELTELFLKDIFNIHNDTIENDQIKEYFTKRYAAIISRYIMSHEKMTEGIIEKLINLQNDSINVEYIIDELKNKIEKLEDEEKKNILLAKFVK